MELTCDSCGGLAVLAESNLDKTYWEAEVVRNEVVAYLLHWLCPHCGTSHTIREEAEV